MIETLVAVTLLTVAIVAPMSLAAQSLATAYYARDQITAAHLAQEAIESVRHVRDGNILKNLGVPADLLSGIPVGPPGFVIDTRNDHADICTTGTCPLLKTDGQFYAQGSDPYNMNEAGWTPTRFTRSVLVQFVKKDDGTDNPDEVRVSSTVSWRTGGYQIRSFTLSENLYRWVNDGTASGTP